MSLRWGLPGLATFRYTMSDVFFRAATASSCRTSWRLLLFTWGDRQSLFSYEGEGRLAMPRAKPTQLGGSEGLQPKPGAGLTLLGADGLPSTTPWKSQSQAIEVLTANSRSPICSRPSFWAAPPSMILVM